MPAAAGWCLPGHVSGMRTRPLAGRLVAVAALCAFAQLAAACGGPAGPSAHPAPVVSHRQAGPPGTPTAGPPASPPGGPRPQGAPPRAGWAVPGSVIRNLGTAPGSPYHRGEKVVALTFDDGPSPVYTPQILRILAAARAPASFEIIGMLGAAYPGILRAENAAGMVLVNHTWAHVDLALLAAGSWPAEVDRTTGRRPRWLGPSPPGGDAPRRAAVAELMLTPPPVTKNGLRGDLPSPALPGSGPGGRPSASWPPGFSAFPPPVRLPAGWCGPAPSLASQTLLPCPAGTRLPRG